MAETVLTDSDPRVAESIDAKSRLRRLTGPLAAVAALAGATLFVALVDPNSPGHYPVCPTKLLTGFDCPGCGGLRATHDLAHGDVAGAFGHNALFVLFVPVIVVYLGRNVYFAWVGRQSNPPSARTSRLVLLSVTAAVLVFTVVRNLPFGAYLGSG